MEIELNICRKLAHSFHKTTGLNFDDLFQEACCAYLQAVKNPQYDPRKMAKTSYAYMKVKQHLILYLNQEKRHHPVLGEWVEEKFLIDSLSYSPEKYAIFGSLIKSLSKEALTVLNMVFESPHEFLEINSLHRQQAVRSRLIQTQGWSEKKAYEILHELRKVKRELQK
ncbi:MAG: hypothetical protein GWN01_09435 [Nitrosopumilaceae archaeon]|nr:hypothetical protein [Nitrosopumilaceae archaeon]NIU87831.1 hypothetical protein [Nitrosopumilaceae archaeon]NIV65213.1 hypothetical protein [Nitrosopumilaceae archaeon]NIX61729.1 hypothetical protein [Nitrosopumilaceae archaeon]